MKMEFAIKEADLQIEKAKLVEKDEIATAAANREKKRIGNQHQAIKK